jgi:hypothetical protein
MPWKSRGLDNIVLARPAMFANSLSLKLFAETRRDRDDMAGTAINQTLSGTVAAKLRRDGARPLREIRGATPDPCNGDVA